MDLLRLDVVSPRFDLRSNMMGSIYVKLCSLRSISVANPLNVYYVPTVASCSATRDSGHSRYDGFWSGLALRLSNPLSSFLPRGLEPKLTSAMGLWRLKYV